MQAKRPRVVLHGGEIVFTVAARIAGERYPDSVLRTDPVRVRDSVGDERRRHERAGVRVSGRDRDDHGDGLLHSRGASGGQTWTRAVRVCDVHFLHLVSTGAALGEKLWLAGRCIHDSRLEGIRRAGAQGDDHRRSVARSARAYLWRVLFDSRWRGHDWFFPRRVALEHWAAGEFYRV